MSILSTFDFKSFYRYTISEKKFPKVDTVRKSEMSKFQKGSKNTIYRVVN